MAQQHSRCVSCSGCDETGTTYCPNFKAVIKPTTLNWQQNSLGNLQPCVHTHILGHETLFVSCLTAETLLSLLDKFLTRNTLVSAHQSVHNMIGGTFKKWALVSTRFSKKKLTKAKRKQQERLEVDQETLENKLSSFASRLEVLTVFHCGFIWAHTSTTSFRFLVRMIQNWAVINFECWF